MRLCVAIFFGLLFFGALALVAIYGVWDLVREEKGRDDEGE